MGWRLDPDRAAVHLTVALFCPVFTAIAPSFGGITRPASRGVRFNDAPPAAAAGCWAEG